MQAMILAAGMGRRMKKYTKHHTKCMIEVGGKTLLTRVVEALEYAGIKKARRAVSRGGSGFYPVVRQGAGILHLGFDGPDGAAAEYGILQDRESAPEAIVLL